MFTKTCDQEGRKNETVFHIYTFNLHAYLTQQLVVVVFFCNVSFVSATHSDYRRGVSVILWFWDAKCIGCTSVAVWDGSQFDAYNRPASKDLSRDKKQTKKNLLKHPTKGNTQCTRQFGRGLRRPLYVVNDPAWVIAGFASASLNRANYAQH